MRRGNSISHILVFIQIVHCVTSFAQGQKVISGTISDATGVALPFVTLSLKKSLLATVSNESGNFDFKIPASVTEDTLVAGSIGYIPFSIPLSSITSPLNIKLKPAVMELKEVEILPMPPTYYIKIAMNKMKDNYPSKAFETQSYYREKISENEVVLNLTEAVFKSYYANYQDTASVSQHQLLLYKQAEPQEPKFMSANKKQRKKKKKSGDEDKNESITSIGKMFGGPDMILKLDLVREGELFLDSSSFKHFDYVFDNSTSYNGRDLMVIAFKSRKRVDHMKSEGKIYIDNATDAIVAVHYTGDFRLPLLVGPAAFLLGYGIEKPSYEKKLDYELIDDKWYPKNIQASVNAVITKKYLFKENEHSNFAIEGIFAVNKFETQKATSVTPMKRFDPEKPMEEQVYNDNNLRWPEVNSIKTTSY